MKYDSGWVGRYRVQEGTLLGFSILPSAAWRVNENLSVGASLNAMVGKFENKVAVNNIIGSDGSLKLDNNAWGIGANVGLLYEVNRGTRFGITYNSPVRLDFNAQPQWNDLGPGIRALFASRGLLDANVDLGRQREFRGHPVLPPTRPMRATNLKHFGDPDEKTISLANLCAEHSRIGYHDGLCAAQ